MTAPGRDYRRLLVGAGASNIGDGIGLVAYPWLASAITRSPGLIAAVAVVQRLPWLLFSLPAGVFVDRHDRRRLAAGADAARAVLTALVAVGVIARRDHLAAVGELEGIATDGALYAMLLVATVLLGMAEVLGDNAGQTLMPVVVAAPDLERANGRLWAVEQVTQALVGPMLASVLLLATFSLPLVLQTVAYVVAAVVIASMRRPPHPVDATPDDSFADELRAGVRWLWGHQVLRTLALSLAVLTASAAIGASTYVLLAQEVLGIGPVLFAVVGLGGTVGSVIGGFTAPRIIARLGSGGALAGCALGLLVVAVGIAAVPVWPVVLALSVLEFLCVTVWSVVTVSFRQAVIPADLLGRVNSAYRWIGWGALPIGAALGGVIVSLVERVASREWALRSVWLVAAAGYFAVWLVVATRLPTRRIDACRTAAPLSPSPTA